MTIIAYNFMLFDYTVELKKNYCAGKFMKRWLKVLT